MNESHCLLTLSVPLTESVLGGNGCYFSFPRSLFIDLLYLSFCLEAFLVRMRDYMPPAHRQLIEGLSGGPSLRDFIMSCSSPDLCQGYNSCVSALVDLRNYHLSTVAKYVIVAANQARTNGCPLRGLCTALDSTGTGGSNIMGFLKSVRNDTLKALIPEQLCASKETEM